MTSDPLVATFEYAVENHTWRDYDLPTASKIYIILPEQRGLKHDKTLRWASGTFLPVGQTISISIQIEYEYFGMSEADRDDLDQLADFINGRLAEIDGFVALDEGNRYEIIFPKPKLSVK